MRGDRIAAIGAPGTLRGRRVVDAADRYVTPGFIDPHTHSDLTILLHPRADTAVRQGVTTHVTGNCGMSAAPLTEAHRDDAVQNWAHYAWGLDAVAWDWRTFGQYLARRASAAGTPSTSRRSSATARCGSPSWASPSAPSPSASWRAWSACWTPRCAPARTACRAASSTRRAASPSTEELLRLCRVVARHQGIYTSHVRGERETILAAVTEALELGRAAGCPVEVSHNAPKWGAPDDAVGQPRRSSRRRGAAGST